MVRRLRILAPALFLPSFLLTILATLRDRQHSTLWRSCVVLAGLFVWALIRAMWAVPINSATLEWNPAAPPENWRALVKRAERFHVIAAWASVVAFLCLLGQTFYRQ